MAKFETIWKQPSAFVSGDIKSFPINFIQHGTKFISPTIGGGITHTGKVTLKLSEEAVSFVQETLKDLGNEIAEGFNDILEAAITEDEQAENTKIALEKIVTTDVEDRIVVGLNSEDLAATVAAQGTAYIKIAYF